MIEKPASFETRKSYQEFFRIKILGIFWNSVGDHMKHFFYLKGEFSKSLKTSAIMLKSKYFSSEGQI